MHRGYFKFWRCFQDNPRSNDPDYVALWLRLLMLATHKPRNVIFKGKRITIKPGQFLTGRIFLADKTGINQSKIERLLKNLKTEQQIEQQTSNVNRLITIVNWEKYQANEQQIEQPVNNQRTTSEQPVNTYKNEKNEKNIKNQDDLNKMVTKIVNKEIKDSSIIEALKHHNIPGTVALKYYKDHSLSFLIKKIWHFRYNSL